MLHQHQDTHHHGLLAGLGAGAAGVIVLGLLLLGVWHRVSGPLGDALIVLVWALVLAALAALVYAVWFLALRARYHLAHPETLTRHSLRAEVIPVAVAAAESPALPAPAPLAALSPPVIHNWNLPSDPAAAAAVLRAVADSNTEGI